MTKFSARLKELRELNNYTQSEVANLLGVNRQTISQYERGIRQPQLETLEMLADIFNVDMNYLLGQEDLITRLIDSDEYKLLLNKKLQSYTKQISDKNKCKMIPVYKKVTAGFGHDLENNVIGYVDVDDDLKGKGELYAIRVTGDSMIPEIRDGDCVIVQKDADVVSGDIAVVAYNGDEATCKRVKFYDNGLLLMPENTAIQPIFYTKEQLKELDVHILGKVVEIRRKL